MKPALLFCLVLLPFLGCRKAEKQVNSEDDIHEINVGILQPNSYPDSINYKFYQFQTVNLNNDSIYYTQHFYSFIDSIFTDSIKTFAGKSNFKKDLVCQKFLTELRKIKNGDTFLCEPDHNHGIHSLHVHTFYYNKGSEIKYFFYQDGNQVIDDFLQLIDQNNIEHKLVHTPKFLNRKELHIANFLEKNSDLKFLPYFPPPIQMKIKFTPPVEKK